MGRRLSRRELLKNTAAVGAAGAIPAAGWSPLVNAQGADEPVSLTTDAFRALEAVVARLIPADANGPGALEAGAARYIDRALANALADSRERYSAGLAALDNLAIERTGHVFAALDSAMQDALLHEIDDDLAALDETPLTGFVDVVLGHTIEGTFGDPRYGGNRDFIGWNMIGYPGLRLAVTASDQQMSQSPQWTRNSAYELAMFESLEPEREFDDD